MSDDLSFNVTDESGFAPETDEDFEEISSDEVDRVVEALEALAASTGSENIRYFLDEAANQIYELIYDEDDVALEDDDLPHEEAA